MKEFAEQLKQVMRDKSITLTDLSRLTGIGKSSISQYLSGKNEPTKKRKELIEQALGCSFRRCEPTKLSVDTVARLMGKSKVFVYQGLRDGVFPWGYGVKVGTNWSYYISPVMFAKHTGIEVKEDTK